LNGFCLDLHLAIDFELFFRAQKQSHMAKVTEKKLDQAKNELSQIKGLHLDLEVQRQGQRRQELEDKLAEMENKLCKAGGDAASAAKTMAEKEVRLNVLLSHEATMLRTLKRTNIDTYHAVEWLREHGRAIFRAPVHEPIMLVLRLADPSFALYVESLVSRGDLETFVCEDAADASRLMNELRIVRGLKRTNVVHAPACNPPSPPTMPLELLGNSRGYISEHVRCPPAVASYLCRRANIHNVPVFDDGVDLVAARSHCRQFFVGQTRHRVRRMRYNGSSISTVDNLADKPLRIFQAGDGGDNDDEVAGLRASIENLRLEKTEAEEQRKLAVLARSSLENEIKSTTQHVNEMRKKVNEVIIHSRTFSVPIIWGRNLFFSLRDWRSCLW
jgi:chromosome segregation ATPase